MMTLVVAGYRENMGVGARGWLSTPRPLTSIFSTNAGGVSGREVEVGGAIGGGFRVPFQRIRPKISSFFSQFWA